MQELLTYINEYYSDLIADEEAKITDSLSKTKHMIDINEKQKEIQSRLQKVVDIDDRVKTLIPAKKKFTDQLKAKK